MVNTIIPPRPATQHPWASDTPADFADGTARPRAVTPIPPKRGVFGTLALVAFVFVVLAIIAAVISNQPNMFQFGTDTSGAPEALESAATAAPAPNAQTRMLSGPATGVVQFRP